MKYWSEPETEANEQKIRASGFAIWSDNNKTRE